MTRIDSVGRRLPLPDADADAQTLEVGVDERERDVVALSDVDADVECEGELVLLGLDPSVVVRVPVAFALVLGAFDVVRVPDGAPDDEAETEKEMLGLVLTVVESVAGMVVGWSEGVAASVVERVPVGLGDEETDLLIESDVVYDTLVLAVELVEGLGDRDEVKEDERE